MATSGKIILLLMMMQACLLVHAKSLRLARKTSIVTSSSDNEAANATNVKIATRSLSCSPNQDQMDYYNGLYLNGKDFYYALKAVETDRNRTELTITTEDTALIANISDQSRFTPARMDTANKVVCAKLLQEMDAETSLFSSTALCAWDYICDYKADRFPNYLFKARCKTARCNGDCNKDNSQRSMCQSHGIHVTVLQMRDNCKEWVWGQELVPIACTCTSYALA